MDQEKKEQLLREKADSYLICYNEACDLHEHCLHWLAGPYVDGRTRIVKSVNLNYAPATAGRCDLYCDDRPVMMPVGMKEHFYNDIPQAKARQIKRTLISDLGRTIYYRYHSGLQPIPPAILSHIEEVCRGAGWEEPLHFDSEREELVW